MSRGKVGVGVGDSVEGGAEPGGTVASGPSEAVGATLESGDGVVDIASSGFRA